MKICNYRHGNKIFMEDLESLYAYMDIVAVKQQDNRLDKDVKLTIIVKKCNSVENKDLIMHFLFRYLILDI